MKLWAVPTDYAVVRLREGRYEALPRQAVDPNHIVDFDLDYAEALELAAMMSTANDHIPHGLESP